MFDFGQKVPRDILQKWEEFNTVSDREAVFWGIFKLGEQNPTESAAGLTTLR